MRQKKQENIHIAPVVTILGHVNHGKTSILDYIRKTNVASQESGQITQHINAYEINFNDQRITFIDTPGHQAFAKMRSRGSQLANIALLVIDANEGMQPQTKEALDYLKNLKLPYIVVLNKIDKLTHPDIPSPIEEQFKEHDIELEEWGGDVPLVKTSAKTGQGIDELLETIVLLYEACLDTITLQGKTWGIIIESHVSARRGKEAIGLLKEGCLKVGDYIRFDSQKIKIKQMFNWQGKAIKTVSASQPVKILGFEKIPSSGQSFEKIDQTTKLKDLSNIKEHQLDNFRINKTGLDNQDIPNFNLLIKTDVFGSQDALYSILEEISQKLEVNFLIIKQGLGRISESDLKLAQTTDSIILGFRIKETVNIKSIAEQLGIKIINFNIIYELEKEIKALLSKKNTDPKKNIIGELKVLAIFGRRKISDKKRQNLSRMIIGGEVTKGKISKNATVNIIRNNQEIGEGRIIELEQDKQPCLKVLEGKQCGLLLESSLEIKKDDFIRSFVLK